MDDEEIASKGQQDPLEILPDCSVNDIQTNEFTNDSLPVLKKTIALSFVPAWCWNLMSIFNLAR